MTDFAGITVWTDLRGTAGASVDLSGYADPPFSAAATVAQSLTGSAQDNGIPVVYPKAALAATVAGDYTNMKYGNIIVVPRVIDGLFAPGDVVRYVDVWNISGRAQTCTSVIVAGSPGVTVRTTPTIPGHFPQTECKTFTVDISADGPPTFNDTITWSFSGFSGTDLRIINGARLVVFTSGPEWSAGIAETVEWLTDVLKSYAGIEQRIQLRDDPTRGLEFDILAADAAEAAALQAQLDGWQARVYGVPWWVDATVTTAAAAPGDLAIAADTTTRSFTAGESALLWAGPLEWEAVQVETVSATGITVSSALLGTWPAGSLLVPLRRGYLDGDPEITEESSAVLSGRLKFTSRGTDGNV